LYSKLLVDTILKVGNEGQAAAATAGAELSSSFLMDIVDRANQYSALEHLGSATCTTLQLLDNTVEESTTETKQQPMLRTLNVGDSGYSIHRYNVTSQSFDVLFVSEVGQKRFNYPNQLGGKNGDAVRDVGTPYTHKDLQPSTDILVVFSDGASDNLYPQEYHECLQLVQPEPEQPVVAVELVSFSWSADCIAKKAYFLGKDANFDSPFAQGGRESGYYPNKTGGKHDDITVVVAQIVIAKEEEDNDPYYKDSITLYTGPVGKVEDMMPMLKELQQQHTTEDNNTNNNDPVDDGKDEL